MHEYGVALEIATLARQSAGEKKIRKATLRVGDLSGVFSESLTLYLELILREQQTDTVELAVEKVKARFACACGMVYTPEKIFDPCPSCGGFERTVIDGNECTLESIEVEDE